jgi:hypothetical protein
MDSPDDRSRRVVLRLVSGTDGRNKTVVGRKSAARQLAAARDGAVSAIRELAQIVGSREEMPWFPDVEQALEEIDAALTSAMYRHYARLELDGADGNGSASRSVEPVS